MQPSLLFMLTVITIAVGLFIWLGGLGFKKIMFALIGLCFGTSCMLFYTGINLLLVVAVIGIFVLIAIKLQDTFLSLIASAATVVVGYLMLIRPYFRPSNDILAVIRQLTIGVPYYNWLILLVVAALPFAVISIQDAPALFASAAGTILILAGTVMALLNFGYPAVSYIAIKQDIFLAGLTMTIAAGVVVQLWLLPKVNVRLAALRNAAKTKIEKVKADKDNAAKTTKTTSWRTA